MRATSQGPAGGAEGNLWVPTIATITRTERVTEVDRLFEIELPEGRELGHKPGQFVQVSVFGFGEAPISICSSPSRRGSFELCVRKMGSVTQALHRLGAGDRVGIRGPFGNGFPVECMQKMDCLVVAGGIGMAPLRSLINTILAQRDRYGRLIVMYGARTPRDLVFAEEVEQWGEDPANEVLVTIDSAVEGWEGHVGVVTTLFPEVEIDPANTVVVAVVGPPVMYRFVFAELASLAVPEDQIYFSLERNMKCGMGKCGHCQVEHRYVCVDGPVFSGRDLARFRETL